MLELISRVNSTKFRQEFIIQKDPTWCHSFYMKLQQLVFDIDNVKEDIDEVDGRTEDVLRPLVKLYFLKILFV